MHCPFPAYTDSISKRQARTRNKIGDITMRQAELAMTNLASSSRQAMASCDAHRRLQLDATLVLMF